MINKSFVLSYLEKDIRLALLCKAVSLDFLKTTIQKATSDGPLDEDWVEEFRKTLRRKTKEQLNYDKWELKKRYQDLISQGAGHIRTIELKTKIDQINNMLQNIKE